MPPDPTHLFVYGTLMFPEILEALLGTSFPLQGATLTDYRRYAVQREEGGASGPVIFPEPGAQVEGRLLTRLTPEAAHRIQLFEDAATGYDFRPVQVRLDSGETVTTRTYVGMDLLRELIVGEWTMDTFREGRLAHYLSERIPRLLARWKEEGRIQAYGQDPS